MSYRDNTLAHPLKSGYACISRNALNARYCRVLPVASTLAPGLRTGVVSCGPCSKWVGYSSFRGGRDQFYVGNFYSWNVSVSWSGYNSDDGTRLFVNEVLVMDNGSWHGPTEKGREASGDCYELLSGLRCVWNDLFVAQTRFEQGK